MADITSQFSFSESARSGYQRVLASIVRGFGNYARVRSRRDRIEALQAKTDAELATLGIKRDDIISYVFRDLFYI
ncbi:hypothetical protein U5922_009455 [Aquicoccus sp. G2-2]|uniref:hypothetical protein n=1 Tax=Aquicoccus sp. G2-2 TaxID=3092120 RepID=UPI002ADFA45D|nr:hypothetical protein [Aquicoccus sp. G2-2]MEA1113694.1 hypothetical protein [Aquicoccus sp. G2-2]